MKLSRTLLPICRCGALMKLWMSDKGNLYGYKLYICVDVQ